MENEPNQRYDVYYDEVMDGYVELAHHYRPAEVTEREMEALCSGTADRLGLSEEETRLFRARLESQFYTLEAIQIRRRKREERHPEVSGQ